MALLIVCGVAVGVFAVVAHYQTAVSSRVTETSAATTRTVAPPKSSTSESSSTSSSTASTSQTQQTTVEMTTAADTKTTEAGLSDSLLTSLVGLGALLVVAGAALPRVTKIGVPGGGEIDLSPTPAEQVQAASLVAPRLAAHPRGGGLPPEELAARASAATSIAARELAAQRMGLTRGARRTPEAIADEAVAHVLGQ